MYNINKVFIDKKFRAPRIWSNDELRKFSCLLAGRIINVSGWKDEDKEGGCYKEYFPLCDKYYLSNYKPEARGFQGIEGEIYIDLEKPLDNELKNKFDVVLNHTVLEHVFDVNYAFKNLCQLSSQYVVGD